MYSRDVRFDQVVRASVRDRRGKELLNTTADFHDYIIIRGRRVIPVSAARQAQSSRSRSALVHVNLDGESRYGEVMEIFTHRQGNRASQNFAVVRWLVSPPRSHYKDLWANDRYVPFYRWPPWSFANLNNYSDVVDVQIYARGKYSSREIIPIDSISSFAARTVWPGQPFWICLSLKPVCSTWPHILLSYLI